MNINDLVNPLNWNRIMLKMKELDRKHGIKVCFNSECFEPMEFSHFFYEFLKSKLNIRYDESYLWTIQVFLVKRIFRRVKMGFILTSIDEALKLWNSKYIELFCCQCVIEKKFRGDW